MSETPTKPETVAICEAIKAMMTIADAVERGAVRVNDRERLLAATNNIQWIIDAYKDSHQRIAEIEAHLNRAEDSLQIYRNKLAELETKNQRLREGLRHTKTVLKNLWDTKCRKPVKLSVIRSEIEKIIEDPWTSDKVRRKLSDITGD